jgi:hypothetical protein
MSLLTGCRISARILDSGFSRDDCGYRRHRRERQEPARRTATAGDWEDWDRETIPGDQAQPEQRSQL